MYYLYIIESAINSRWYVGITEEVESRLRQHNAGKTRSTKAYIPYKLVYTECYQSKTDARKREIAIKRSGVLRKMLKAHISSMAPSSSG